MSARRPTFNLQLRKASFSKFALHDKSGNDGESRPLLHGALDAARLSNFDSAFHVQTEFVKLASKILSGSRSAFRKDELFPAHLFDRKLVASEMALYVGG